MQLTNQLVHVVSGALGPRQQLRVENQVADGDSLVSIFHSDYRWRKVRNIYVKNHPFCEMCGLRKKLEAHHIQPWHLFPELRFEQTNLVTLDRECHYRFGHFLDWHAFNPDIRRLCAQAKLLNPQIEGIGL